MILILEGRQTTYLTANIKKWSTYLITSINKFYISIPFAVHFADHPAWCDILYFSRHAMQLATVERFCVKCHRGVVPSLGTCYVNFSAKLNPGVSQYRSVNIKMTQMVADWHFQNVHFNFTPFLSIFPKYVCFMIKCFNGFIYHTCTTLHKKNKYKNEKRRREQDLQP